MARKRPNFDRVRRVKAIARDRVGTTPPSRALSEKPLRDKPKHKKQLWTEADNDSHQS